MISATKLKVHLGLNGGWSSERWKRLLRDAGVKYKRGVPLTEAEVERIIKRRWFDRGMRGR